MALPPTNQDETLTKQKFARQTNWRRRALAAFYSHLRGLETDIATAQAQIAQQGSGLSVSCNYTRVQILDVRDALNELLDELAELQPKITAELPASDKHGNIKEG